MKCNVLQLLKVAFISFVVCSPGLLVFYVVWQQHLKLVATNNLLCSNTNYLEEIFTCSQYAHFLNSLGLTFGLFLIFSGLLVFSVDGYLEYRATERQKIIEELERMYHNHY